MLKPENKVSIPEQMERPYVPKGSHPVENGSYLIATNEIERLFDAICQWVDNRAPGAIVYGRPRLGKSKAIDYIMKILPDEYKKKLPVYKIICRHYKIPNEGVFFEDLLKDIGHNLAFSGKANIKRDRLTRFLIEQGERSQQHRIVLFLDEAHRLHELHYGWLIDVYNELDRVGIQLTIILVGQNELLYQRSAFIQAKKAQIIGRFMVHEYEFTGIQYIDDLRPCLSGYDHDSEYPLGSGWSYGRYFFPEAFNNGHRLEHCAEELMGVFNDLRRKAGLTKPVEIPMQYLTLTVEYAIRKFGANGKNVDWLTTNCWEEAILNSGYVEAEIHQDVI
ncbi:ATP-binding protein [Peribacillus frigoritolerans]|uniref:ATP-binding protein n=1 Tax=Peribacillus frigoritolerans TaxID=450367 RepID=UPI002B2461A4|nr:ATP-binding protein [Peribacillus frigoritolerans]MEB2493833.1 ATP-binding protein [Peribacillus frigoritolerans]